MNRNQSEAEARQTAYRVDRRRSQRVLIRMAVTLHFEVPERRAVKAHTSNVSVHGALVVCPESLGVGAQLFLEHNGTRRRQACRVVRPPKQTHGGFEVAVDFENPAPGFWQIAFPPPDWKAPED